MMSFEEYAERGARATDPDTSWAATMARLVGKATDRRAALVLLYEYPRGLTDFEIGTLMGRQQTSAGKRRGELRDEGLVYDTGERRAAPSGAMAIVWGITERGRRAYETLRQL